MLSLPPGGLPAHKLAAQLAQVAQACSQQGPAPAKLHTAAVTLSQRRVALHKEFSALAKDRTDLSLQDWVRRCSCALRERVWHTGSEGRSFVQGAVIRRVVKGVSDELVQGLLVEAWLQVGPRAGLADMRSLVQRISTSQASSLLDAAEGRAADVIRSVKVSH